MARIAALTVVLVALLAAPARAGGQYGIWDMPEVSHNLFVGTSPAGAHACDFEDGGNDCSVIVTATLLDGPYDTCQQALDAYNAGATPASGTFGPKVTFKGNTYYCLLYTSDAADE